MKDERVAQVGCARALMDAGQWEMHAHVHAGKENKAKRQLRRSESRYEGEEGEDREAAATDNKNTAPTHKGAET